MESYKTASFAAIKSAAFAFGLLFAFPAFALLLAASPVWPAWGSVATLGSVANKTADQSSTALTTSAAAEAGNVVALCVTVDNNQTTDGDEGAVSSVTDSAGGNTWAKAIEFTNGQGAAQAGATISLWYSKLTNQIASAGTITANFTNNTSRDAVAMSAWEFTIGAGSTLSVAGTNSVADDAVNDPSSLAISTLANAEHLFVRCTAREDFRHVATATTSYTLITDNGTTGGADPSNMSVIGEFLILTGTSSTSSITITGDTNTRDMASVMMALDEVVAAGANFFPRRIQRGGP